MGKRCAQKRLRVGRALDTETAPHGKMTSAHRDINSRQSQTEPVGRGSSRSLIRKHTKKETVLVGIYYSNFRDWSEQEI